MPIPHASTGGFADERDQPFNSVARCSVECTDPVSMESTLDCDTRGSCPLGLSACRSPQDRGQVKVLLAVQVNDNGAHQEQRRQEDAPEARS
jgi:hypothetical protein